MRPLAPCRFPKSRQVAAGMSHTPPDLKDPHKCHCSPSGLPWNRHHFSKPGGDAKSQCIQPVYCLDEFNYQSGPCARRSGNTAWWSQILSPCESSSRPPCHFLCPCFSRNEGILPSGSALGAGRSLRPVRVQLAYAGLGTELWVTLPWSVELPTPAVSQKQKSVFFFLRKIYFKDRGDSWNDIHKTLAKKNITQP